MWDEIDALPAPSSTGSAVGDFFSSVLSSGATAINQALVKSNAQQNLGTTSTPLYGVDQNGNLFFQGQASFLSSKLAGIPVPLVLVAVGAVALTLFLRRG